MPLQCLRAGGRATNGYIAEVGGTEGVKLEQQVLITETGYEIMSAFPLESKLR
jgi:Xaa-Pro aminopeptidase